MTNELKLLCELQLLQDKENEIKKKLNETNKSLSEVRLDFKKINDEKNKLSKELADKRNILQDKDLELQTLYENIKKHEKELFSSKASNPKFLTELENKIKEMKTLKDKSEEVVFEIMDEVDKLEKKFKEEIIELNKAQLELDRMEKEYKDLEENSKKILEEIDSRRKKIREEINSDYTKTFDKALMMGQGKAISKVEIDRCSVCGTNIPLASLQKLKKSTDSLITCENCGRILVLD
jgi:predicted  nucleic acid-binding Zn-ribbon protein